MNDTIEEQIAYVTGLTKAYLKLPVVDDIKVTEERVAVVLNKLAEDVCPGMTIVPVPSENTGLVWKYRIVLKEEITEKV